MRSPWWEDLVPKSQDVKGLVPGETRSYDAVWEEKAAFDLVGVSAVDLTAKGCERY